MNLIISKDLAQAIHDYLLSRPMGEVEVLALELRNLSPEQVNSNNNQTTDKV